MTNSTLVEALHACRAVRCVTAVRRRGRGGESARAQPLDRLTGKVVRRRGRRLFQMPTCASKRCSASRGGDFLGQRTFAARTNAKGEWALLAFKAGIWVFDAEAPGRLPDSIALPFNLVAPAGSGIDRLTPVWHPVLRLSPAPAGRHRQDPR